MHGFVRIHLGVDQSGVIFVHTLADALKGDRIIGTVLLQPWFEADYEGRPPVRRMLIACLAASDIALVVAIGRKP